MGTPRPRLVCFDLDGTVMLRPNSLQYLLTLNRAPSERRLEIDRRETNGLVDWITADYERATLIAGLPVEGVEENFDAYLETIGNLDPVLRTLKSLGIVTALISSGPVEVAEALGRRFAFDYCFGSTFETADGVYTGRITRHLGSKGKLDYLLGLCATEGLALGECVAVGDGPSDADLFAEVGMAVGLNCSAEVARFVRHEIRGDDLSALVPLVLGVDTPAWPAQHTKSETEKPAGNGGLLHGDGAGLGLSLGEGPT